MKNYTAISLFSGAVDGLAIAAQAAGITVTHHVEWDAWCCRVLRMNHPDSTVINADIHEVKGLPYADVIMGGSPCQDFSIAGDQAGFAGERYLWPEMRRIVGECRPRVVIHENVRGGVSLGLLDRICSDMESDGYEVWPLVYPAAIFGAPHERYRMFHVGLLADTKLHGRPEQRTIANTNSNQQQHLSTSEQGGGGQSQMRLSQVVKMWATAQARDWKGQVGTNRHSKNLPDQVLIWQDETGYLNPAWVELLMGLPPGYTDLTRLQTSPVSPQVRASISIRMSRRAQRRKRASMRKNGYKH